MSDWVTPNSTYPPPKDGEPPLHRAARLGDHDQIRALIEGGIEVDSLFDIRLDPGARPVMATALMVAAGSGDGASADTVRLLLDLGADVAAASPPGEVSALWLACSGLGWNYPPGGDVERVQALLDAGADPDQGRRIRRFDSSTRSVPSIAKAAERGDPDRVRLLLKAGADPDPVDGFMPFGIPLYTAARSGSGETVRLLLDAGASVTRSLQGHADPVLAQASSAGVVAVLLAAGADPNEPCRYQKAVAENIARCEEATVAERVKMLRLLVDAGADLDPPDRSPLYGAAMIASPNAVEALLLAGADPNGAGTPLGAVCFLHSPDRNANIERVIDLLVAAGADPNDRDRHGCGPLHSALLPNTLAPGYQESDGFNAAATVALLANGASIDITFPDTGARPLHAAATAANPIALQALLAAGADPSGTTPNGDTPLGLAKAALAEAEATATSNPSSDTDQHHLDDARRTVQILTAAQPD